MLHGLNEPPLIFGRNGMGIAHDHGPQLRTHLNRERRLQAQPPFPCTWRVQIRIRPCSSDKS
jgi:hypothetical protein